MKRDNNNNNNNNNNSNNNRVKYAKMTGGMNISVMISNFVSGKAGSRDVIISLVKDSQGGLRE